MSLSFTTTWKLYYVNQIVSVPWFQNYQKDLHNLFYRKLNHFWITLKIAGVYNYHDDVIKWKHFLSHWSFVLGILRSPVNSPQKGRRRGALMLSLVCVWTNGWVNNRDARDLRRHRAHYDVTVMQSTHEPHGFWATPSNSHVVFNNANFRHIHNLEYRIVSNKN